MTTQEASNLFERLSIESTKNSEIKIYEKFIYILTKLKDRELSEDDMLSVEKELDGLNLKSNPTNQKKFFKKALHHFEYYLKNKLSITPKGYYTNLYMGLGLSFGLLFGVAILSNLERSLGLSLGLIGGMLVGTVLGRQKDAQAKASGNML